MFFNIFASISSGEHNNFLFGEQNKASKWEAQKHYVLNFNIFNRILDVVIPANVVGSTACTDKFW